MCLQNLSMFLKPLDKVLGETIEVKEKSLDGKQQPVQN